MCRLLKLPTAYEATAMDAGKNVLGIKRHIALDTQAAPYAIAVPPTNVTDRSGALLAFEQNKDGLVGIKSILCDEGYDGKPFADAVKSLLGEYVSVQVVKRNELDLFDNGIIETS